MKINIFDSTLRDGIQGSNIDFSISDKIKIVKALDDFGIDFIEAGNPFSNPKDIEFFKLVKDIELNHSKLVAFGSTCRKNIKPQDDNNIIILSEVYADYISIFGKTSIFHVKNILGTTKEENLRMIKDTIEYLKSKNKHIFFDAEHFFDGFKANQDYAIECILTAQNAGAEYIVLCDTNGGSFPDEIDYAVKFVASKLSIPIGIHCHNDNDCACANSISAVKAGATQVQGTFAGIGERCGNTNLSSLIPNLKLKLGYDCLKEESISNITEMTRFIAEVANISLHDNMPFVGKNAFSHKAGMHVDAVLKNNSSFEHVSPENVGNTRAFIISEVSGRTTVLSKLQKLVPNITKDSNELSDILNILKEQQLKGYLYEAAEASFDLLVLKYLGMFKEFFYIDYFKIIGEQSGDLQKAATAMVKVKVDNQFEIAADEGDGPVNALDKALRAALSHFYPDIINEIELVDYKVRVMNTGAGTAAVVRVLIESSDGINTWTTVGASTDIINASVKALVDSIEYKLYKSIK